MMHQLNALIIEDDPRIAEFFEFTLVEAGYQVSLAADGKTASEALHNRPPDLIMLDIRLPDMSGIDILQHIRDDEQLKNTYVIIATGEKTIDRKFDELANFVLTKPIDFSQLLALANRIGSRF